jgi:hypothetical protein
MTMTEDEKITALKNLVDRTCQDIESGDLTEEKARQVITDTRAEAEKLIPDDMDKYDLIYGARFERLMDQYIKVKQD